jgi:hypothetical protein
LGVLFDSNNLQDVADVWKKNEKQAIATAKEWTRKYAMVRCESEHRKLDYFASVPL